MNKFTEWMSKLTESSEDRAMREVAEKVANCLGVNPAMKDDWVGRFKLETDNKFLDCEIYSSVLHIGNDSLILMNQHEIDAEIGKVYLVDYFTSQYTMRLLRMPDPETGEIIFMLSKSINQEIQYSIKIEIDFSLA
jgi:hypothetical protein